MSYCVNCGTGYENASGTCPACHLNQEIPSEIIDSELLRWKGSPRRAEDLPFGYPGEKAGLTLAIVVSAIIAGLLGTVSVGLFFVVLILSLVSLKVKHIQSKKNLIRVSDHSFATVFKLTKLAAYRLQLPLPEVYIVQDPSYNAGTMGFGRYGFIVVNSAVVHDFAPGELLFVIGHEMGHLKRHHTTWLTLLQPAKVGGARFLLAPLLQPLFNVWSVKAEYTADQAGLIAGNDVHAASTALLKLAGGPGVEREVDIEKIIHEGKEGEEVLSGLAEYLGTHPFIHNRVRQLLSIASSPQFRSCLWWTSRVEGKSVNSGATLVGQVRMRSTSPS